MKECCVEEKQKITQLAEFSPRTHQEKESHKKACETAREDFRNLLIAFHQTQPTKDDAKKIDDLYGDVDVLYYNLLKSIDKIDINALKARFKPEAPKIEGGGKSDGDTL
jgi:hypothetical protein